MRPFFFAVVAILTCFSQETLAVREWFSWPNGTRAAVAPRRHACFILPAPDPKAISCVTSNNDTKIACSLQYSYQELGKDQKRGSDADSLRALSVKFEVSESYPDGEASETEEYQKAKLAEDLADFLEEKTRLECPKSRAEKAQTN